MSRTVKQQTIVLHKKVKKQLTRPQKIGRNILLVVVMIAMIVTLRSGTFTEEQAYQKQLTDLGITETSFQEGTVKVINDVSVEESADTRELWAFGFNYEHNYYDFEPERAVMLETTLGGEPVQVQILIGKRMFLWYDSASMVEYVNYKYYPEEEYL